MAKGKRVSTKHLSGKSAGKRANDAARLQDHKSRLDRAADYLYLPKAYHRDHDLCMGLIGQIEDFIIREEYSHIWQQIVEHEGGLPLENEHILDFLLRIGKKDEHDRVIKIHVIKGLLMDICYFAQEAFSCSLKMRLTVTFALFRKPFVYSLIVILRMLFEEGFIDKFNNDEKFDPAQISPEDRNTVIGMSLEVIKQSMLTVNDINEMIFDKSLPDSLTNMSDKALHLSTTRNRSNLSGPQNFNFIFSDHESIDWKWEYIYSRMPALLLYLVQVTDLLVFSSADLDSIVYQRRLLERLKLLKRR